MFFPLLWVGGAALLAYLASQSSTPTNTPPQKRPPDMPPTPSPNLALAILQSWDGHSIHDADPAAWAAVLLRNDRPSWAVSYLRQRKSTCALVGKAYLYEGGCRCHEHGPYEPRDGMAVADVESIARRHGAWINDPIGKSTTPDPGDLITIDPGNPHVLVVLGMDGPTGYVHSMDGGQGDGGAYTQQRYRKLIAPANGANPYLEDVADGHSSRPGYQRPIWGRTVASRIFNTLHLCK